MSRGFTRSWLLCGSLLLLIIISLIGLTGRPLPVQAQGSSIISVNTVVDEWSTDTNTKASSKCSLREALQATVSGNPQGNQGCGPASISQFASYIIDLPPGTYLLTLPDELPNITKKISIDGGPAQAPNPNKQVTIDGGWLNNGRNTGIFYVASGGELNLKRVKLQNGRRPFGGAIWLKPGSSGVVKANQVDFYRNLADNDSGNGDGGAVSVDSGVFSCYKCEFIENRARSSGGAVSSGGVQVQIEKSRFFRNSAQLNGGAYAGFGGSNVTYPLILDSIFRENWVVQTAVPANWPAEYRFTDDQSGGGALYNKGYMVVQNSQFLKNYTERSKGGGALYNQGELWMLDVAIGDNKARPDTPVPNTLGGAILNDGLLTARRISIHSNEASFGGGVMNRQGGRFYLANSTVADNLAKTGGGVSNGYNFLFNGTPTSNPGGEVYTYLSTLVRANDDNADSSSVENLGNGYFYMANSITDQPCAGVINSFGGNLFNQFCQRVPGDFNDDQTATDLFAANAGALGLQGLADNSNGKLFETGFLSVKVNNNSPAVDLARDAFCTAPELQEALILASDQRAEQRPIGPKCDAGALEIGAAVPVWKAEPEVGLIFPLTVLDAVPSRNTDLLMQNTGGGVINWSATLENNANGVFKIIENQPTSGGLVKNQPATLMLSCTPPGLGNYNGLLMIETDLPGQEKIEYPLNCVMRGNPTDPAAWQAYPPGPLSAGQAPAGGQASTQIQVGNLGANPMAATLNLKDVLANTIEFIVNVIGVNAGQTTTLLQPGLQSDVTVPSGGTMNITVTCNPSEPGLLTGTLEIQTNDPSNPLLVYNLSCEGVPAPDPEVINPVALSSQLPAQNNMGMALSPDGSQLLSGHWSNNEIEVYAINNPANGFLSFQTKFSQPNMSGITGIRYSSDGKNVYYTSLNGNGIVAVNRAADGVLSHLQTITTDTTYVCGVNPIQLCTYNAMGGARALDMSPDDKNLYVSGINDDTLTVLSRNPTTGNLNISQILTRTIDDADLMNGPFGVLVSDDGQNVYVAARDGDTVLAFSRDGTTGKLRYLTHYQDGQNGAGGLDGPVEFALSPDGKFLYVASLNDDAIQIFARNPADGFITPLESLAVGDGPYHMLISNDPEGSRLAVALWLGDEIKVYRRDRQSGSLSPLAGQAMLAMNGPVFLVGTPDDRFIYATLFDGQGVQHMRSRYHAPLAQNLSPASVTAGGGDFTLTVKGSRFYAESQIVLNNQSLSTTFIDSRKLEANVPAALIAGIGTAGIVVRNPTPGGGDTAPLSLEILAADAAPIPSVEQISPPEVAVSGQPLNLVISGAGFTAASQVLINGTPVKTTPINDTTLLVQLEGSEVIAPGPLAVTVVNGPVAAVGALSVAAEGSRSTPVRFSVAAASQPALPAIHAFSPASLGAGSDEQWLTVTGYNFSNFAEAQSVAYWNGEARETVVQDASTLRMRLSAADLAAAGEARITVRTIGVDASDPRSISVLPAGQNPVAQVDAAYAESGQVLQLVISGSDFVDGATVLINNLVRPATLVNPYVLTVAVTYDELRRGMLVQVNNPGAAPSNELLFEPQSILSLPLMRN